MRTEKYQRGIPRRGLLPHPRPHGGQISPVLVPIPDPVKAHEEHFFPILVPALGFNPRGDPHPRITSIHDSKNRHLAK